MALTGAEKQKRHRDRVKLRLAEAGNGAALPSLPGVSNLPANRRWSVALEQVKTSLESTVGEMSAYFGDRSEEWQESERGEAFQEKIDSLQEALDKLNEVTF